LRAHYIPATSLHATSLRPFCGIRSVDVTFVSLVPTYDLLLPPVSLLLFSSVSLPIFRLLSSPPLSFLFPFHHHFYSILLALRFPAFLIRSHVAMASSSSSLPNAQSAFPGIRTNEQSCPFVRGCLITIAAVDRPLVRVAHELLTSCNPFGRPQWFIKPRKGY